MRGVNVRIAAGETVALLGPNGAGKSTTIDMLLGLLPPDAGSVSVFGRSPAEAVADGAIGAMLQTGELIRDLTVRRAGRDDGLALPRPLDVEEALDLAGVDGDLATSARRSSPAGRPSACASPSRSSATRELLVLDEPTVALDVEGRRAFWTTMRAFAARGKTILFATHYLEEADAYADRAVLMAHGTVVADGPTTEIRAMVGIAHDPRDAARLQARSARRRYRASPAPSAAARR